ncbi:hypothetical protein CEE37_02730 [candidate division LCP-89 bacterium B3_LCP]|uniref:Radical SAM core domain-containing protein n=1 Tax=candidate division LCP-89 bacterium B3_LCP TaxID=2012998 RepID=A0A532V2T2_UNCL8|nr:MAG: hypothetical protein CEE37_02730 [candidate division LCP-89 bacterium B3_LCP]
MVSKPKRGHRKPEKGLLSGERRAFTIQFPRRPQAVIVFPAPYSAAIANLGYLTIWERLNKVPGFTCDRAVWNPRSKDMPRGMESGLPLSDFPLIFISSSFELDLIRFLDMLITAGIEPEIVKRGESDPIVVAGGITPTLNPHPWEPVVDLTILGEGEDSVLEWIDIYQDWILSGKDKERLLEASSRLKYVWMPGKSEADCHQAEYSYYRKDPPCSPVVHPQGHFGDCLLIEINRGCPHGCSFCAVCGAFPARFADTEAILQKIDDAKSLNSTKIGLVGAAAGDHPHLKEIVRQIIASGKEITISSLRIERTDSELLHLLASGGFRTVTVAPEVADEELRRKIGKRASDDDLVQLAKDSAQAGLYKMRAYMLIGLPDPEPLEKVVAFVKMLRREAPTSLKLDFSFSSFIPKPRSVWQDAVFASTKELNQTKRYLRSHLARIPGVSVKMESTRTERLSAVLSRGDCHVGEALIRSQRSSRPLEQELKAAGIEPERYLVP